jgi:hypothetical protein
MKRKQREMQEEVVIKRNELSEIQLYSHNTFRNANATPSTTLVAAALGTGLALGAADAHLMDPVLEDVELRVRLLLSEA